MLLIAGTITFDPAHTDTAKAAAAAMMAATHQEEGNIAYSFSIDMADPSKIHVFEAWEDQASLDAHFQMPHMATFQAAVADIGISHMDLLKYQVASTGPVR